MNAYSINPQTKEVKKLDIDIQANTVYTFFNSILADEILILDKHTIYSDAEALTNNKQAFFIADQLILGEALVLGKDGFLDIEATIPLEDLKSLVSYELSPFYDEVLKLLQTSDINLYKVFDVSDKQLDSTWVLHVFSIADENTQKYFIKELQKAMEAKEDISAFMKKMAGLAVQAMG